MRKYCSLTSIWTLGLIFVFFVSSARLTEADPTDDFSFSLAQTLRGDVYSLISHEKVSEILKDRLDLFPQSQASKLAHHILALCKRYRLDPAFILSLMQVESEFRVKAISPVGAVGLMQLMVPTANFVIHELGVHFSGFEDFKGYALRSGVSVRQLEDPFVNTAIGIAYLAWLRDYYEGLPAYYVLAAYNVGPARLDELLAQKSFKPVETKKYFLAIRRGVPKFRFYRKSKPRSSQRRFKASI